VLPTDTHFYEHRLYYFGITYYYGNTLAAGEDPQALAPGFDPGTRW